MTPVFAIVEADIAKSNVAAQMMDLTFFIVLLLGLNSRGVTLVGSEFPSADLHKLNSLCSFSRVVPNCQRVRCAC